MRIGIQLESLSMSNLSEIFTVTINSFTYSDEYEFECDSAETALELAVKEFYEKFGKRQILIINVTAY